MEHWSGLAIETPIYKNNKLKLSKGYGTCFEWTWNYETLEPWNFWKQWSSRLIIISLKLSSETLKPFLKPSFLKPWHIRIQLKIAILHTDFRIYWPPRIKALNAYLLAMGHTLVVIEIAGEGSSYAFAEHTDISDFPSWIILFPDRRIENISAREADKAVSVSYTHLTLPTNREV